MAFLLFVYLVYLLAYVAFLHGVSEQKESKSGLSKPSVGCSKPDMAFIYIVDRSAWLAIMIMAGRGVGWSDGTVKAGRSFSLLHVSRHATSLYVYSQDTLLHLVADRLTER